MTNPFLAAAREYLRLGLHPIPCAARSKRPLVEWKPYQLVPPLADEIEAWWDATPDANVALVLGRGTFAVDLDGGFDAELLLDSRGITLPDAPRSRTGSGFHVFLSAPGPVPDRVGLLTTDGHKPQVDIRGVGIVVAPPSIHPDGPVYIWLDPLVLPFPAAPPALLSLIAQGPAVPPQAEGETWVAVALRGVPMGQRDQTCARLAGYFLGLPQMDEAGVADLLGATFGPRCTPPFPAAEIQKTVRSIARRERTASHPRTSGGRVIPLRPGTEESEPPPDDPPLPASRVAERADVFLARRFPATEPVIETLFPRLAHGQIAGEERLGKSTYAMLEALAVALGTAVCGFPVYRSRRVWLIQEEDDEERAQTRMRAILAGLGLSLESSGMRETMGQVLGDQCLVSVKQRVSLDDRECVEWFRHTAAEFRPEIVYFDALSEITLKPLGGPDIMRPLQDHLDRLARDGRFHWRFVNHFRRSSPQSGRARGSQEALGGQQFARWSASNLFFWPVGRTDGASVTRQVKDGRPDATRYTFTITSEGPEEAPTVYRLALSPEQTVAAKIEETDRAVFDALLARAREKGRETEPGSSAQAVADMIGCSRDTARRSLNRLVDAGKAISAGKVLRRSLFVAPESI